MDAISVQFNHVHMIAAISITFLVLDDDEERVWGYGIGPAHDLYKSTDSLRSSQEFYKPCEDYFFDVSRHTFATIKIPNRLRFYKKVVSCV